MIWCIIQSVTNGLYGHILYCIDGCETICSVNTNPSAKDLLITIVLPLATCKYSEFKVIPNDQPLD